MDSSLSIPAASRAHDLSILNCQLSAIPRNPLCYLSLAENPQKAPRFAQCYLPLTAAHFRKYLCYLPLAKNPQKAPKFTQCFLPLTATHFRKYLCYLPLTKKGGGGVQLSTLNHQLLTILLGPLGAHSCKKTGSAPLPAGCAPMRPCVSPLESHSSRNRLFFSRFRRLRPDREQEVGKANHWFPSRISGGSITAGILCREYLSATDAETASVTPAGCSTSFPNTLAATKCLWISTRSARAKIMWR